MTFVFFLTGLGFLGMAGTAHALRRRPENPETPLPWAWLALSGLGHGLGQWLNLPALHLGDPPALQAARLVLLAVSSMALIEFGRQGFHYRPGRTLGRRVYLPLLALSVAGGLAGALSGGLAGLQTACLLALGLPGGLLAGWALVQARPALGRLPRAGLGLAAVSLAAYTPALAFSIPALSAVLALGAMTGVWLYQQALEALFARPGLWRRWALPAAFVLLVAAGWAGASRLESDPETELLQAAVVAVAGAAGAGADDRAAEAAAAHVQLEPADWETVTTKRQQLGLPVMLATLLFMAAVVAIGAVAARRQ